MSRQVSYSYPAADYNAIAATQNITTSTGAYVVLNGALSDYLQNPTWPVEHLSATLPGIQRTIGVFSTGDLSAVVFYASGVDTTGRVVTASFAGASGGSSAATDAFATFTAEFHIVNCVFATAAATSNFTVGTGATGSTRWFQVDNFVTPVNIGGTIDTATHATVTPQNTADNPNTSTAPVTFNHATGAVTADTQFSYTTPVAFVRYVVSTNSATGVGAVLQWNQAG